MNTDEFIENFRKKGLLRFNEERCLICSEDTNWIVYLQLCLEEAGVSLEKFCSTPMYRMYDGVKQLPILSFRIEERRLLFGDKKMSIVCHKFVSIGSIRSMLDQILDN